MLSLAVKTSHKITPCPSCLLPIWSAVYTAACSWFRTNESGCWKQSSGSWDPSAGSYLGAV